MKATSWAALAGVTLFAVGAYLTLADGFSKFSGALLFFGALGIVAWFVAKNNPTLTG